MEQEEQSMEEILASIRRILSSETQEENTPSVEDTQKEYAPGCDDSFETEEVKEDEKLKKESCLPPPCPQELTFAEDQTIELTADMLVSKPADLASQSDSSQIGTREKTETPAQEKTDAFTQMPAPAEQESTLSKQAVNNKACHQAGAVVGEKKASSCAGLESLVADLIKPYLTEWLKNNLQGLTEKVLQEEIKKMFSKNFMKNE